MGKEDAKKHEDQKSFRIKIDVTVERSDVDKVLVRIPYCAENLTRGDAVVIQDVLVHFLKGLSDLGYASLPLRCGPEAAELARQMRHIVRGG